MLNKELVSFETPKSFPYYTVLLNNNEIIFQQERDGDVHSWLRLKLFLEKNPELKIIGMEYYGQNSIIPMPKNQEGYCFGKRKMAIWPGNQSKELMCVGHLNGGKVYLTWLDEHKIFEKEVRNENKAGFFLIKNG